MSRTKHARPRRHPEGTHPRAAQIAREFHREYETLAPDFGWKPQEESSVPWDDVPAANRDLMVATVTRLLNRGVIR